MEQGVLTMRKDSADDCLAAAKGRTEGSDVPVEMSQDAAIKLYRTSWLARNIIDMYAEDMTAAGVKWICDAQTAQILERAFRRLHVWEVLTDAIRWSRLFGGAIVCIDMGDNQPANSINPKSDIIALRVFSRYEATPDVIQLDPERPGEPGKYKVTPRIYQQTFDLHCSRAIRFTGAKLPPEAAAQQQLWGDSVLNALKTPIERYNSALESVDELLKRCYLRFLGLQNFWQAMQETDSASAMGKAVAFINEMQNISGLTIADSADVFSSQQYSFGGLKDILMSMSQDNAGAAGVPLVRLFGMSPAGFSTGESDLRNYYDNILRAQESKLREPIQRIVKVVLESEGIQTDVDFEFIPVQQPTEAEKQAATQSAVDTIMRVYEGGLVTADKALEEIRRRSEVSGLFASITEADVSRLKDPEVPLPDLSGVDFDAIVRGEGNAGV